MEVVFHRSVRFIHNTKRGKKMAAVHIKKGEGRALKAGGLWVYDNEIGKIDGAFEDGDLVDVFDFDQYFLGRGFINTKSTITVRIMTRKKEQPIDRAFLKTLVRQAVDYRKKTVDLLACRLIFGEADGFPGLVVDKFSDVLVVESLALGIDRMKETILELLKEELESSCKIKIRGVYERSDAKVRLSEGMERLKGFIGEPFDPKVEITENGVRYLVDVAEGQKTGFFLDQKYNRKAVAKLCAGAKVLDCFTHTGSFALNAAKGGAVSVLGVDASETGIAQARENAVLNGMEDRVTFICRDVFALLPELVEQEERFDVVILDPPAFTKSRKSVKNAVKGYREINARGMRLVKDGGFLATCSCSHFINADAFAEILREAARGAHKCLRQVEFKTQAPDHPILWSAAESYYLKFYIFQVCDRR